MPFTKVMIHCIWATKNRQKTISKELKPVLLKHIKENSIHKSIHIDCLNCVDDHIHLLISLGREQTVSKVIQLIKGESSFWVNNEKIIAGKFEWQDEYIALSVSESAIERVRAYILNQEEHHKRKSFEQEHLEFLLIHGFNENEFG